MAALGLLKVYVLGNVCQNHNLRVFISHLLHNEVFVTILRHVTELLYVQHELPVAVELQMLAS